MKKIIFFMPFLFISLHSFPNSVKPVIASYTTSVADQSAPVKTNIQLAVNKINRYALVPGKVFSFNETVGEGSSENGFLKGNVLYRDEVRLEPGGGLCQVSSTLFNALLMSGCSIVERHRHFQPVTYVPYGLDATIKYGQKDLRMKNVTGQTLYLYAEMNDKLLVITVKGDHAESSTFVIDTEEEEVDVPLGDTDRPDKIRPGISVEVYRKKTVGGKTVESMLLYRDFYPPVRFK
jgi:vancomycin resistance protein YoaR